MQEQQQSEQDQRSQEVVTDTPINEQQSKREADFDAYMRIDPARAHDLSDASLIDVIRFEHMEVFCGLQYSLLHAQRAGHFLIAAKSRVGHGKWSSWLDRHVAISERSAQVYMRIAKKTQHAAFPTVTSIRGMLRLLGQTPKQVNRAEPPADVPCCCPSCGHHHRCVPKSDVQPAEPVEQERRTA